jgi:hypothetical protein
MDKTEKEKKFEEYREYLIEETMRLVAYIDLYKHLCDKKQDRLEELNIAPGFFDTVLSALFSGIINWTNNLFSEKSERGFFNFLAFVENELNLFSKKELQKRRALPDNHRMLNREKVTYQTVKLHRKKIKSISLLDSVGIRRDKFHAHFDKKYFFDRDQISKDAPIAWDDIEKLKEIMKDIISTYSDAYDGKVYKLQFVDSYDIDYILDILHEHNRKTEGPTPI